ncbi:MAG: cyclopropane-fatty-acyl-phospholipid synthase family protein [Verrucomicrobiota bacterium]|nr:cyclopropane-fatty-acyl-phospholipid synthase family protein [Verrucomicrobiota bacterium]
MNLPIYFAERGLLNDAIIRKGIRCLLAQRLRKAFDLKRSTQEWIEYLSNCPVAEETEAANSQHYEVPADYFCTVLGPHLKYSSGYWENSKTTLEEAETAMLRLSCERAELSAGQAILELGCGWGSLSLWMAATYPNSTITAVSNSNSQRVYIEGQAQESGLTTLEVMTCDINNFGPKKVYDRIVSVEMMEHVRNHKELFSQLKNWLHPSGKIFVHIFTHRSQTYLFEDRNSKDWMSRYFFTGGIMPSADLLPSAALGFDEEARWSVNGQHYSRTLEAWLQKQDLQSDEVLRSLEPCYGKHTRLWLQRWRIFYMACSELFAYNDGHEWCVTHYRFSPST